MISLIFALVFIVLYHLLLYPIALKILSRNKSPIPCEVGAKPSRHFVVVVPVFNEQNHIEKKIQSLVKLEYDSKKLTIIIADDGSSDDTVSLAEQMIAKENLKQISIKKFPKNEGKVAVLNKTIAEVPLDAFVLVTDASATLSPNVLARASAFLSQSQVGVYTPAYTLGSKAHPDEKVYWDYQGRVREMESVLFSPIGFHGSGFAFSRLHWQPLKQSIINDDFVMPLQIVAQNYRGIYDKTAVAQEEEFSSDPIDFTRRCRISAGNVQQIFALRQLLNPKMTYMAWMFFSSKVLRVFVPSCLMLVFGLTLIQALSSGGIMWWGFLCAQLLFWMTPALKKVVAIKPVSVFAYMVNGFWATQMGWVYFLTGRFNQGWKRAKYDVNAEAIPTSVRYAKWIFDKILSLVGMIIFVITFPVIAILIKCSSKGPIFYTQIRVGKSDHRMTRFFKLYKYRTMRTDAEANGAQLAKKNDPRVTKFGKFMRQTRIDEIPQFINVLKGDMSMVGPRPERPEFYQQIEEQIPYYAERIYGILPGISGFAQVKLGYDESIDDVRKKVAYDHAYAACLTNFWLWLKTDIWIVFQTFGVLIRKVGQ